MNQIRVELDFTTPVALRQEHGAALWAIPATRFNKTAGKRDTYSITFDAFTDSHVEDLVGEAMNEVRRALPDLHPNAVRCVGVHVTQEGQ